MSSENQQPGVSQSQVHQEGIDHIKSQTGLTGTAPASNPGSEDASAGISKDSGGVSGSAYVDSPVPSEQKGVVQSTVDTVKGLLAGLSLGGASTTTAEKDGPGEPGAVKSYDEGNNESTTAANTGVVASTTAAVSAATAAVLGSREESKTDETRVEETKDSSSSVLPVTHSTTTDTNPTATTSSATKDVPMTDASTSAPATSATSTATDEPKTNTTSKDPTQTREETETAEKRGHDDADNKLSDAPGEGASHAKKDNWPKENRDAIPTAGGEKLGEKHWGESQMVPEIPKKVDEGSNVSSAEGQPDSQTRDNTAQNTGGAAPPTSSGHGGDSAADGEGKQKLTDKIKDKLNIGKKE